MRAVQPLSGGVMTVDAGASGASYAKAAGLPNPRPAIAEMYRTPEPTHEDLGAVRLDRNERLGELPTWFLDTLRKAMESSLLSAYPRQARLRRLLSEQLGVSDEQVVLTPGSDAAFKALYQAYVRPGDRIVMLEPSYAMYPVYARMFEAEAARVPFAADRTLDSKALLEQIDESVRLVVLANPNQPTGTLIDPLTLRSVVERAAEAGALIVVDEAYYPFSDSTAISWVREVPQLLVTRTFSKAGGLAGLRLGYAVGHPEVIANLAKVRTAHDINSMAILCAEQVLAHPRLITDYVAEVGAGRLVLAERASRLGLDPLPTHGNFLLIRVTPRAEPARVVDGLRRLGLLVKGPFDAPCLAGCIRVTLGPVKLMVRVADGLERILHD